MSPSPVLKLFSGNLIQPGQVNTTDIPVKSIGISVPPGHRKTVFTEKSAGAIRYLSIKMNAADQESALRKNVLSIWFDDSSVPQVHAPVGDFFGAAPGINPYKSLPFTIQQDGKMICRFVMPYHRFVRTEIDLFEPYQTILGNHFSEKIDLNKGSNEIVFESKVSGKTSKVRIDFIWMRED